MRLTFILTSILIVSYSAFPQTFTVQGIVTTADTTMPVQFALVTFIDINDTTKKYSAVTNTSGHYQINIVTSVEREKPSVPTTIALAQNYPNPFSSSTAISYQLDKPAEASITIYNILGQEVKRFTANSHTANLQRVLWDGTDYFGRRIAAGIYFYKLQAGDETVVKKMVFGMGSTSTPLMVPQQFPASIPALRKATVSATQRVFDVEVTNTANTNPPVKFFPLPFYDIAIQNDTTINFDVCPDGGFACPIDFLTIDYAPAWSPDGSTIAYVHDDNEIGKSGIYLIDADGSNKRPWHAGAGDAPGWSPDGEWIVFHEGAQIYKKKLNGDSLTQLTTEGRNFFPDWSPDGVWIAYNKSTCEGPNTCGIWVMKNNGTQQRFIAAYGNYPNWRSSENEVLYQTRAVTQEGQVIGDSLWRFNINTNVKSFMAMLGGINWDNRYFKYSPDGTKIAFTSQSNSGKLRIWTMNADGSNVQQLTARGSYTCDWSADGEWIVYTDSRYTNGRLWLIRKDGTEKRQLTFE